MQWVWRPFFDHLGKSVQIFTGAMYDHYCWPGGVGADETWWYDKPPTVTDKGLDTFNGDFEVQNLMDFINHMSSHYRGNHILIPMGCDFSYSNAR